MVSGLVVATMWGCKLNKNPTNSKVKVGEVIGDEGTHLFFLEGPANQKGTVHWQVCTYVNDRVCDGVLREETMNFVNYRTKLQEIIVADVGLSNSSMAYATVLGAVMATDVEGDIICSPSNQFVKCQHQRFESYNNEFSWLKGPFEDAPATPSPSTSPEVPGTTTTPETPVVTTPEGPGATTEPTTPVEPETPVVVAPVEPETPSVGDDSRCPGVEDKTYQTPVCVHGKLRVEGRFIVDEDGNKVQLKGMSTHGLHWQGDVVNRNTMNWLRGDWNATVFRAAMYTAEGGYNQGKKDELTRKVDEIVADAIALGMYVIIDWHILRDNDPNSHTNEAVEFFDRMAKKYRGVPNVIYEIANEPNGGTSWDRIKNYANQVIPAIRKHSDGIIIVGTENWSQRVDNASRSRLTQDNLVYALHFYAATDSHQHALMGMLDTALQADLPVFVSEFGSVSADGNGGVNEFWTRKWIEKLNENHISWVNWSFSRVHEGSAAIKGEGTFDEEDNWTWYQRTESGQLIMDLMRE